MPVTDTATTPKVTCPVAGGILEPARIWPPLGAASWNQPGFGSHHSKETSQTHSHITDIGKERSHIYMTPIITIYMTVVKKLTLTTKHKTV
jgi:hypothetical protein